MLWEIVYKTEAVGGLVPDQIGRQNCLILGGIQYTMTNAQGPQELKQPQNITDPPPYFTMGRRRLLCDTRVFCECSIPLPSPAPKNTNGLSSAVMNERACLHLGTQKLRPYPSHSSAT